MGERGGGQKLKSGQNVMGSPKCLNDRLALY